METDRWLGLDLRHLIALKAIADESSFGKAAERLGYTQSAISQQIATLERIVGLRLVERPGGPRPISLTEAGGILLRHADAIQARLLAAKADMAALEAGDAGRLRVGTFQAWEHASFRPSCAASRRATRRSRSCSASHRTRARFSR